MRVSGSVPRVDLPADFWSGTGGAIIGSFLTGVVAVGAAFLAAWLTRRHDRQQDARHSASRLNTAVHDALTVILKYEVRNYPAVARDAISQLHRGFLIESAYMTEAKLVGQGAHILGWLRDAWTPAIEYTSEHLPKPRFNELTGSETQDLTPLRDIATEGAYALSNFGAMLNVWQMNGDVIEVRPLPDFDVIRTETEGGEAGRSL